MKGQFSNDVVIIGGGLAGLTAASLLSNNGFKVLLVEKKEYPFHRVCGEYVSNEVKPFLLREGLLPSNQELPQINKFQFTSIKGRSLDMPLDFGGFGISRHFLDNHLYQEALANGAEILTKCTVNKVEYEQDTFTCELSNGQEVQTPLVLGAHGKTSAIDRALKRDFLKKRSPYIGVKYHLKTDFPKDKIALHNFRNGYCGISAIEEDKYNLCYLSSRSNLKSSGSVEELEDSILKENPFLKSIFSNADFLFEKPLVINEFSFAPKQLIENHVIMIGDSAGLITPLCGNGMAMAIHSAFLVSNCILKDYSEKGIDRATLESNYLKSWNALFKKRLWIGRQTQKLFGSRFSSELAAISMNNIKPLAKAIMKGTHGEAF